MDPQLGAEFDGSGGEGWQSNWLGSLDKIFLNWLCLHQSSRLSGTAHHFPRLR